MPYHQYQTFGAEIIRLLFSATDFLLQNIFLLQQNGELCWRSFFTTRATDFYAAKFAALPAEWIFLLH